MQARFRPSTLWDRARSTYWFFPSLQTAACILLAVALVRVDRFAGELPSILSWAYGGGPDGARALLSALAGSMITVVSVTFSVTIVAVTVAAQHFGPRLLNNFMRDRAAQLVLGTFIGTFAYCLFVLRAVYGGDGRSPIFVPHLAVSGAVALALASVATLIYYVHHVASSMRVSHIVLTVARDLGRTIERLYPERIGESGAAPVVDPPEAPDDAAGIGCVGSGYVQAIEPDAVLRVAREAGTVVWLRVRPGDFMTEGEALGLAHPRPADLAAFTDALNTAVVLGEDRTPHQDVAFPVQQLVEVALHALSPALNEPFTAITCVDRLGEGFSKLARRKIPSAARVDRDGQLRVVVHPFAFAELLTQAFAPMRSSAARVPEVAIRILAVLARLLQVARRADDRAAISREARLLWEAVGRPLDERIAEAYVPFQMR
jgi:uncharacterized membrane protein